MNALEAAKKNEGRQVWAILPVIEADDYIFTGTLSVREDKVFVNETELYVDDVFIVDGEPYKVGE